MALEICPHCSTRQAWYFVEDDELFLKCVCGHLKCVYSEKQGYKKVVDKNISSMPKKGSKLSRCLGIVASLYPKNPNTKDVADLVGDNTSSISSRLLALQHKGYVTILESRKGKSGGSIWSLTEKAKTHFNLVNRDN